MKASETDRLSANEEFVLLAIRHSRNGENCTPQIAANLRRVCGLEIPENVARGVLCELFDAGRLKRRFLEDASGCVTWWSLTERGEAALDAQAASRRALAVDRVKGDMDLDEIDEMVRGSLPEEIRPEMPKRDWEEGYIRVTNGEMTDLALKLLRSISEGLPFPIPIPAKVEGYSKNIGKDWQKREVSLSWNWEDGFASLRITAGPGKYYRGSYLGNHIPGFTERSEFEVIADMNDKKGGHMKMSRFDPEYWLEFFTKIRDGLGITELETG